MSNCRRFLPLPGKAGFDKASKKRVWLRRLTLKFGMVLASDEIRVITQFDQLGQRAVWRRTGNLEPLFSHLLPVFHVELVAVPMPLKHFVLTVNFFRQRSFRDLGRPSA